MYAKLKPLLHMAAVFILYFLTLSFSETALQIRPSSIYFTELLYVSLDILCVRILVYLYATYILKSSPGAIHIRKQLPDWRICAAGVILPVAVLLFYVAVTKGCFRQDSLSAGEQAYLIFSTAAGSGIRAAVTEEMLFRGLAVGALSRAASGRGILYSALLYAAVNAVTVCPESAPVFLLSVLTAFTAALVLSEITCLTGSIWTAVVIHAAFNIFTGNSGILYIGNGQGHAALWRYLPAYSGCFAAVSGLEAGLVAITGYALLYRVIRSSRLIRSIRKKVQT